MSCYISIREYKSNDGFAVTEVVRNAYLSNVNPSWYNALTKEITFQLIVMFAAVFFIFFGFPLHYCLLAVPLVLVVTYASIYSAFLVKSMELMHTKNVLHCWVAEACEPYFFNESVEKVLYRIIPVHKERREGVDIQRVQRKIIGTVAVAKHLHEENAAWLFRLCVDKRYCHKGVGHALVQTAQNWCRNRSYSTIELAMSECQENARQLFVDTGFDMKQLYHKQVLGSAFTLLMYHLGCNLKELRPDL